MVKTGLLVSVVSFFVENQEIRHIIMKKQIFVFCNVLALFLCAILLSCSVDNDYDLSKDVDLTIAVGNGLSIPLGSTDKIMLTEMIDPEGSDILSTNDDGSYVIGKGGSFDAADFVVDEVDGLHIDTYVDAQQYSMDLEKVYATYDEAVAGIKANPLLTEEQKKEFIDRLAANEVPVSLFEKIDRNDIEFDFSKDDLPKELKRIYRVEFVEPVRMHFQVDVTCNADKELFELLDSLELSAAGLDDDLFYVGIPDYVEFVEHEDIGDDRIYLRGAVMVSADRTKFSRSWDFYIRALEFEGGREVVDGTISIVDELMLNGALKSNLVMVEAEALVDGLRTFEDVSFVPTVEIADFSIKHVMASVEVDIDDINESVDIGLGDDLEFLYEEGTVLDFANPELMVNVDNNSVVSVESDLLIRGFDKDGNVIDGSEIALTLALDASASNRYFITNNGAGKDGYTSIAADLSSLFRKLPYTVGFEMKSRNDSQTPVVVTLGSTMSVSGDYEVKIPLEFSEFALKYTETIEDVLGDDPAEITDYVKNIESVTLEAEILNTIPAELTPSLKAYDTYGRLLQNVTVAVEGSVAAGNGVDAGKVTAPVVSVFKAELRATGNELVGLSTIDLEFDGFGSGELNANEYLKIEKLSLTINKPVEVDLN